MPSSCTDPALKALISPYLGGLALDQAVAGAATGGVSCKLASAGQGKTLTLDMGPGSSEDFTTLQAATTNNPGVTIQPLGGLGAFAFAYSEGGVVKGVDALSGTNLVVSVSSNLTLAQDEALIRRLIGKY